MTEDDNGSDNSQFTGSTINLQDLEWHQLSSRGSAASHFTSLHPPPCPEMVDAIQRLPRRRPGLWKPFWTSWLSVCSSLRHDSTEKAPWHEDSVSVCNLCTKIKAEGTVRKSRGPSILWICGVTNHGVPSTVPHCYSCTLVHRRRSSCLTDASRRARLLMLHLLFDLCFITVRFIFLFHLKSVFEKKKRKKPVHVFVMCESYYLLCHFIYHEHLGYGVAEPNRGIKRFKAQSKLWWWLFILLLRKRFWKQLVSKRCFFCYAHETKISEHKDQRTQSKQNV